MGNVCGGKASKDFTVCPNCGERRTNPVKCQHCGHEFGKRDPSIKFRDWTSDLEELGYSPFRFHGFDEFLEELNSDFAQAYTEFKLKQPGDIAKRKEEILTLFLYVGLHGAGKASIKETMSFNAFYENRERMMEAKEERDSYDNTVDAVLAFGKELKEILGAEICAQLKIADRSKYITKQQMEDFQLKRYPWLSKVMLATATKNARMVNDSFLAPFTVRTVTQMTIEKYIAAYFEDSGLDKIIKLACGDKVKVQKQDAPAGNGLGSPRAKPRKPKSAESFVDYSSPSVEQLEAKAVAMIANLEAKVESPADVGEVSTTAPQEDAKAPAEPPTEAVTETPATTEPAAEVDAQ